MKVDVGLPGQVHRGLQSCFGEGKTSKAVGVQYMMKTHEHAVSFLGECVCVCVFMLLPTIMHWVCPITCNSQ